MICIWSSYCHCHLIIPCFIKIQNEKRPLNGCGSIYNEKQHAVYRRFGLEYETFIRTDFWMLISVCNGLSYSQYIRQAVSQWHQQPKVGPDEGLRFKAETLKNSVLFLVANKHAASLTEQNNRLAYSRNCCCGRILLGYLATSDAKSDIIFLLGDHNFLQRWRNFAPILLTFRDMMRDRFTDDKLDDCFIKLLHLQEVSLIIKHTDV